MVHLPSLILPIVLPFAAANDHLFYKVPNWFTYPTMIVGVLYGTHLQGLDGFLHHVSGISTGLAMAARTFIRSAARSPAFEGGGRRARLRVNLEPLGLSSGRRQAPAFRAGSREVHC